MLVSYVARLGLVCGSALLKPSASLLSESRLPIRIWPTDIDVYGHMNNGKYLTMMDFGRFEHSVRTGFATALWKLKAMPVLGAANVQFLRELRAFQACELTTQLVAWDSKWFFFEQRLEREGRVHAKAVVKGVLKRKGKTVPVGEVLELTGQKLESPQDAAALARAMGLDNPRSS